MTELLKLYVPETLHADETSQDDYDFRLWEEQFKDIPPNEAQALEREVLDSPDEPQTSWVDSDPNGTISEAGYRQQCYWVIGQVGHALDVMKDNITTEEEAQEWLEMKMSIAAAKSVTNIYELATIRSDVMPIWMAYVKSMNINWEAFESVRNK